MDFDAMEKDLVAALASLPEGLIDLRAAAERIVRFRPELEKALPKIMEQLKPHVMAAVMESGMGILDKEGLERAAIKALFQSGVTVPLNAQTG